MDEREDLLRFSRPWLKIIVVVVAIGLLFFALGQVLPVLGGLLRVLAPFLLGLIVAYVFHPIVTFVQRKLHLGRILGILVLALTIAGTLVTVLIFLLPQLYHQLTDALRSIGDNVNVVLNRLAANYLDPETRNLIAARIKGFTGDLNTLLRNLAGELGGAIQPVATGSVTAVRNVAGGLWHAIGNIGGALATFGFVLVIAFYYLADMDQIPGVIRRLLPEHHRDRIWEIALKSDYAVGGFLRGQLVACIGVGVLITILLFFVGLRQYALLIGCFAGLMNFIPYLGPVAGATPAVLWALMTPDLASWNARGVHVLVIVGGIALVQMIDGLIFQPFIVGRNASLHPLAVMLALAIGAQAGLGGMILAVPVACVVRVVWIEFFWKNRRLPGDLPAPGQAAP